MGNYCYVASAQQLARLWGAHGEERGGDISCRHVHSLLLLLRLGCAVETVRFLSVFVVSSWNNESGEVLTSGI